MPNHQWLGSDLDYQEVWDFQLDYVQHVLDKKSSLKNSSSLPHPVIEINRGGEGTYHGPGQLVGYPVIDLRKRGKDLHKYIRAIEEALILTCADFSLKANRREGLTGVWIENRKLASIGVGVKKWITMHGFAINVTKESLPAFFAITPCGIDNVEMTCVSEETGQDISVEDFATQSQLHLEHCLIKKIN